MCLCLLVHPRPPKGCTAVTASLLHRVWHCCDRECGCGCGCGFGGTRLKLAWSYDGDKVIYDDTKEIENVSTRLVTIPWLTAMHFTALNDTGDDVFMSLSFFRCHDTRLSFTRTLARRRAIACFDSPNHSSQIRLWKNRLGAIV